MPELGVDLARLSVTDVNRDEKTPSMPGSYCVPSQGAQDAIAKPPNGTCPWHWIASGSYCLRSGNVRR
jgi:hypothetical protein